MAIIKTEQQYEKILERIEELLQLVDNSTTADDKNFIELDLLSDLVYDYESSEKKVSVPPLPEIIKASMRERGLTQVALSNMLDISVSRVNEILTGKCSPTFKLACKMHQRLEIDANLILG